MRTTHPIVYGNSKTMLSTDQEEGLVNEVRELVLNRVNEFDIENAHKVLDAKNLADCEGHTDASHNQSDESVHGCEVAVACEFGFDGDHAYGPGRKHDYSDFLLNSIVCDRMEPKLRRDAAQSEQLKRKARENTCKG